MTRGISLAALVALTTLIAAPQSQAREFQCIAQINYRQLEGSGFGFLDELKELVEDYMNNNTWTEDRFEPEELIECSIQIVFLESFTQTSFRARLVLTSKRPIYGTTAKTTLLQISDEHWEFSFSQGTPLIFEVERYDALTSVLDYYAYLMLAYDYESFSEMGGEAHFQQAKRVQQLATTANAPGWSTLDREGRFRIVDQMTDARFKPFREAYFKYHFQGLDHFTTQTEAARSVVLEVLTTIQEIYDELSRQYVFDIFFTTKYVELVGVFEESEESGAAYNVLSKVDSGRLTRYNELIE